MAVLKAKMFTVRNSIYLFRSNRMANLATESVVVDGGD